MSRVPASFSITPGAPECGASSNEFGCCAARCAGTIIDETMLRDERDAGDYYRSKILSDRVVLSFLDAHPGFWAVMVLPGWMHGPGDSGPTSAGQTVLDVALERLPGIPPGSFSVVDARDVARAMIFANCHGMRGERYLAAGRHMTMADLLPLIAREVGSAAPTRRIHRSCST